MELFTFKYKLLEKKWKQKAKISFKKFAPLKLFFQIYLKKWNSL